MKLPHAEEALVPRNKIENYLLDIGHPIGGGKAAFFVRFGFSREEWKGLHDALAKHARENEVADSIADADGISYAVEGPLDTPSGRRPMLRSVWLLETGSIAPRFITAYPLTT
jgi:hypothetical protein